MDSPTPQPSLAPAPIIQVSEDTHEGSSGRRVWVLAIIIPLLLGLAVGILTGPKVASSPSGPVGAPSSHLAATCLLKKDKPQVAITWQAVEKANKNVLIKEQASVSGRKNLVSETSSPFKTYNYTDTDVVIGKTYVYIIDTGMFEGWERATVEVSTASCLKSNISSK